MEIQGKYSQLKLIYPKYIAVIHFETMVAILDFSKGYTSAV